MPAAPIAPPRGTLPVLQYCPPAQLNVDASYQRELDAQSRSLIGEIAARWDWSLCQPLVVASRPDRSLFVVDGQHRLEAAKLRGDIPQLPCVIFHPADATDEAKAFVELNAKRRPLTAYALYKGALVAGDEPTLALAQLLADAGLSFTGAADPARMKPGQLNNVGTVRKWHARNGDAHTRVVLACIGRAFGSEVITFSGALFMAVASTVLEHDTRLSRHLFVDVLQRPQPDWLADFRRYAADHGVGVQAAAVAVIRAAYAEAIEE